MDHQLSLFVRKYCFDFTKASKALRSYVTHVCVLPYPPPRLRKDQENLCVLFLWDKHSICRAFHELFQASHRRVMRAFWLAVNLHLSWLCDGGECVQVLVEMDEVDIDSQAFTEDACRKRWSLLDMTEFERRRGIARELMTMREVVETRMCSPAIPLTGKRYFGEAGVTPPFAGATFSSSPKASLPSLVPDATRVGASLALPAQRMIASPPSSAQRAGANSSDVRGALNAQRGVTAASVRSLPPRTQASAPQEASERKQAWSSSAHTSSEPAAPARVTAAKTKVTGDSKDDDSDESEEVKIIDTSQLRKNALAPTATSATSPPSRAAGSGSADEAGGAITRKWPVPTKAEFEKNVEEEKLERSDFTIFTHDLKKTCDGFYNAVKANLPSIQVEEVTDDDDDDVAPVFSNLQVNDKGEYVGKLNVGPLLSEHEPGAAPSTDKPKSLTPSASSTAARTRPTTAPALLSVVAPSVQVGDDSTSDDDEIEEVLDASELWRRTMGISNGSAAQHAAKSSCPAVHQTENAKDVKREQNFKVLKQTVSGLHNAMACSKHKETSKLDSQVAEKVQLNPVLNIDIEAAKGLMFVSKGQYQNAVKHLSAAIEGAGIGSVEGKKTTVGNDDAVKWLLARGKCYQELGQSYNAVPDCAKAVTLDSASVDARLQYAIVLRFSCQYVDASEQIKHLLLLDPNHEYAKLEERRLQQRIAHAQGQDLDTWRRKDGVIGVAKEIQARAERSIEESRSKIESLTQRQKEKELEESFFQQIAEARQKQQAEYDSIAAQRPVLDMYLGGIDVDDLLNTLHEMQPDANIFKNVTPRGYGSGDSGARGGGGGGDSDEGQDVSSLPPLLQQLVGSGPIPELHQGPALPSASRFSEKEPELEAVEVAELPPPTALEVGAGARALKSNISSLLESAETSAMPLLAPRVPAPAPAPTRASVPAPAPAPRATAADKEEAAPISKGSIGAKLRAFREGKMTAPMPEKQPMMQPSAAFSSPATSLAHSPSTTSNGSVSAALPAERAGNSTELAALSRVQEDVGVKKKTENTEEDKAAEPPKSASTARQRQDMAMQQRARGRMQMAGSDDDNEDSEEEQDIMALRSKLKERSKKLSPEEQAAEDRKKEARKYLEERARKDREEQEQRRQTELELKRAAEARQKQLDDLAAASARKRREMDRERDEKEQAERQKSQEEASRHHAKAKEEDADLEEEEDALLKEKVQAASARARPETVSSPGGSAGAAETPGASAAKAKNAAAEFKIEEEEDDDDAEDNLMQVRLTEAQRMRDERVAAAALRQQKIMEMSNGPMAALPSTLFFELSQRDALTLVPDVVQEHCVLLLPNMDMAFLAGALQWMVTPASMRSCLETAASAERAGYGVDESSGSASAAGHKNGTPPAFPFQVVGLTRGSLSGDLCMPSLLPPSTQKRSAEVGAAEPVVMIALAATSESQQAGAAGMPDLARSVKALLASVCLEDVYLGDRSSAPVHETYLNTPMTATLDTVTSVISGKSAVSSTIKSPLFWFVCAPAVVDGGDVANVPGPAGASPDDVVVSVLRPEAVRNGALGPILVRLAEENMDLTSLRILFPSKEHNERSRSFTTTVVPGGCPIIVLGSRGYTAVARWSEVVGPEDPFVAKRTDPTSLRAKYGVDRKSNLMTCSRSIERNRRESQWYFSLAHDMELDESSTAAAMPAMPMMLPYAVTCTTLVLRAGVSGAFISRVVSFCLQNGFRLTAFRRSTLKVSASQKVGLPEWINLKVTRPPPVCLQWAAENAIARMLRLVPALGKLAEDAGMTSLFEEACTLTTLPRQLPHRASTCKAVFESFGSVLAVARTLEAAQRCGIHLELDAGPECIDRVRFSSRLADMPSRFVSHKELPQAVCVVVTQDAVTDAAAMSEIFEALFVNTSAELLGAKLLQWLPDHVAAEMCPYPKDHFQREDFLEHMETGPAFVIAMRMVDGIERIRNIVGPLPGSSALALMDGARKSGPSSPARTQTLRAKYAVDGVRCAVLPCNDAKHALRLMACMFEDDELSWPPTSHGPSALLPPPTSEDVIESLKAEAEGLPALRTVALVKPEARHNFAKILKYIRRGNFKIVCAKVVTPSQVSSPLPDTPEVSVSSVSV